MVSDRVRARCRERIERFGDSELDSEKLRHEAAAELRRAIGFDLWCWALADPTSLIACSGVASVVPAAEVAQTLPRLLALEQREEGFQRHEIARSRRPVRTLAAATDGAFERSRRWVECIGPLGLGDLVIAACRDAQGCWGWLEAYRSGGDRPFDPDETAVLAEVAEPLGVALRRRVACAQAVAEPRSPGVLILDEDLQATSWTAAARAWIDDLPGPIHRVARVLPSVVYAVAGRASAEPGSLTARLGTQARVRTRGGAWAVVDGSALEGAQAGSVAITIRAATPAESLDMLCRTYALTARERELAALVVEGLTTRELAAALVISTHTVKDHLKSIFEKIGVRSRGELAARVLGARSAQATAVRDVFSASIAL
jgi:DNA-binding CsgD family transcriptional regulator